MSKALIIMTQKSFGCVGVINKKKSILKIFVEQFFSDSTASTEKLITRQNIVIVNSKKRLICLKLKNIYLKIYNYILYPNIFAILIMFFLSSARGNIISLYC